MIAELLDLAARLDIPTPCPFEKLRVHYLVDLDADGNLLGITPAYGSTKEKSGEPEIGKYMDCPVYFPLKLKSVEEPEIQSKGGGGISVAEAGHGDIKEIFCTQIRTPAGKSPIIEEIKPPAGAQAEGSNAEEGQEEETEDEDESETKPGKNQHYRYSGWIKLIARYIDDERGKRSQLAKALKAFIDNEHRLTSTEVLAHFDLPDPERVAAAATGETDDEKKAAQKKAKSEATKTRNAQLKFIANAKFTFRVNGRILLSDPDFQAWWRRSYTEERTAMFGRLPIGSDGYDTDEDESSRRITPVFPNVNKGIPNSGMYCPLASFDKAPTKSFGLGRHTLSLSLKSSERAAAALKWLLQDSGSHCKLGEKLVAVFWAVPTDRQGIPIPLDFASLLNEPDALQVRNFFNNLHGHAAVSPDSARFYCTILSSPKSRITVRSWHTESLGRATQRADEYFCAVSLPNVFRGGALTASTLRELANAMAPPKGKSGPPSPAYAQLLETALIGRHVPHSFLASALNRQCFELPQGKAEDDKGDFESRLRARTALIKLYFHTHYPKLIMNEQTHENQNHPAYLCGRVLALMDKIHNAAYGKPTASSPAGRYYGSASSTPALVFPRLCKLARIHLDKLGGGLAYKLEHGVPKDRALTPLAVDFDGLAALVAKFDATKYWPRTLSLEEQGRFAIGFYYERCRKWPAYKPKTNPGGDEPESEDNSTDNETIKS
jgi:CRISPR-associated protein Cas8c/Csd1 subtype I-C